MKSTLIQGLEAAGEPYVELQDAHGGSALVIKRAGRVMGLFDGTGDNFLWTPEELHSPDSARDLLGKTAWHNLGGDRTWIGPEVGTRVPDLSDPLGSITTPASYDPGAYSLRLDGGVASLRTEGVIRYYRPDAECAFTVEKTLRLVGSPLRRDLSRYPELGNLFYTGYEQVTQLRVVPPVQPGAPLCLWSLPVLPGGGDIIIPTLFRASVKDFMGCTDERHLIVEDRMVRFKLDGLEILKIGVKPDPLTGRMGYVRPLGGGESTLVVRNFFVDPSAEYVDVPWDDPSDLGYGVEIYNNGGGGALFGEMEYHTPAVGGDTGIESYVDCSQLWAFRGPDELIRSAGERLLGVGLAE